MLAILSPAKKQDYNESLPQVKATQPQEKNETSILVNELKKLKPLTIKKLMSVSDKIADLNFHRFQDFNEEHYDLNNAKQALFAFQGDAYKAFEAKTLSKAEIDYTQNHLLLLSGLYGYLRPLDLMQPYRLEMKTALENPRGKDLYAFWGDRISRGINKALNKAKTDTIINLASSEYFKAIDQSKLKGTIITVHFKNLKNGQYKVIGINAKRARGAMARYIMQEKITDLKTLIKFKQNGFEYNDSLSSKTELVFINNN